MDVQAITVRLPVDLYEKLRREAFEQHTSQAAIITEALAERYKRVASSEADRHA
jgi:predicted transcriptional regulator